MTNAKQLYALQELDLALDQIDTKTTGAEAELDSGITVARLESSLQAETQQLLEVREKLGIQRLEAENHRKRLAQLDSHLYGGALTNPRDLKSLETEASHARELVEEWDAQLLELSSNEEEFQARCRELEGELAEVRAAWELRSAELKEDLGRLNADRESIGGKRTSLAATIGKLGFAALRGIAPGQGRGGRGQGGTGTLPGMPNGPAHPAAATGKERPPNGPVQYLRQDSLPGLDFASQCGLRLIPTGFWPPVEEPLNRGQTSGR